MPQKMGAEVRRRGLPVAENRIVSNDFTVIPNFSRRLAAVSPHYTRHHGGAGGGSGILPLSPGGQQ
jgi:hypothetical protein